MTSDERYELLDWLGSGGMGAVRRAYDHVRGGEVAIKTLHATDPETIFRFRDEFRQLAGVVHPNLVLLHALEERDGAWSITMEFIRGVDFVEHVRPAGASLSAPTTGARVPATDPITETVSVGPPPSSRDSAPPRVSEGGSRGALDEPRLRAALKQLASGIQAMHGAGKLHCDIKPTNVLVTAEGRVVVVDFGLVTELVPDPLDRYRQREGAGTVPYMPPEQIQPMPLTAAADWYAFGALLYEALAGRLPFEGGLLHVIDEKRRGPPPSPREIAPEAPGDLSELCVELLRPSPAERPEAPDIFAWLGMDAPPPSIRSPFVGRRAELDELTSMFEAMRSGRAVTAIVHGASGIGKSALVRRFLEQRSQRGSLLVFAGRCYEHESVPYKALAGVIDRLSEYLVALAPATVDALLPDDAPVLGVAFPVLKRVSGIAQGRAGSRSPGPDQQEVRRRVFAALRELLHRIGSRTPLVLFVDDLQWGDADSAALLLSLFAPPSPPPLLLLACCRTGDLETPTLELLLRRWADPAEGHDVHRVELGALGLDETREIAHALLARAVSGMPGLPDAVALEAEGSPLFAEELARHALTAGSSGLLLEDVVRERLAHLSAEERRLLEIVAIAGHPVHEDAAARAALAAPFERRALARLRALHLVSKRSAEPEGTIEPYHDRIRVAVLGGIPREGERAHHLALARALDARPGADPEVLAEHYRKGGAPDLAVRHTVVAAERASAALAFSRAASLYRAALDAGVPEGERWRLRSKLGEALANAGKGREAAESFAAAAGELEAWSPGDLSALDLKRRAAEHDLRSGHVDEGLDRLREVLAKTGTRYPVTPAGALFSLVQQRARLRVRGLGFRLVAPARIPAEDRIRVEACWSASLGLSMVDSVRAAYFQVRHERAALALGDPVNVARGLSSHVAAIGSEGGAENRRRCGEILQTAQELARSIDDPAVLMLTHFCAGTAAYFGGQWRRAVDRSVAAQTIGRERCVGVTWEMNSAALLELWALAYLGELPELSRRLPRLLAEARERDDVFAETGLRLGLPSLVALARDRPDDADLDAAAAMRRWTSPTLPTAAGARPRPASGFHSQHYFALLARVQTALYRGDGAAALGLMEAAWPELERAHLLRLQSVRIELRHLLARAALSAASSARDLRTRHKLLRVAEREASHLAREDMPWAAPITLLVKAGVSALRGARGDAALTLGLAASGFDAAEMALYAAAARLQRGRLAGGGEDGDARAWMAGRGVESPARMAGMLVPGCDPGREV